MSLPLEDMGNYLREPTGQLKWTLIGRYIQGEDVQLMCAYINGMTYDKLEDYT